MGDPTETAHVPDHTILRPGGPSSGFCVTLGTKGHLAAPALHGGRERVTKNTPKTKTTANMSQITSGPGVLLNFVQLVLHLSSKKLMPPGH